MMVTQGQALCENPYTYQISICPLTTSVNILEVFGGIGTVF